MTFEHLNIVYTNALCCSSELAVKVSDMYSRGDKCANSEMLKLKVLHDKILILKEYLNDHCNLVKNGEFTYDLSYWDISPLSDSWIWIKTIDQITVAYYNGTDEGGTISQNCLYPGRTYTVSFDYYYVINTPGGNESIVVTVGGTEYIVTPLIASDEPQHVEFTITAGDSTEISFYTISSVSPSNDILIDNVVVRNANDDGCLTEEQVDDLVRDIMKECEICDCQLK